MLRSYVYVEKYGSYFPCNLDGPQLDFPKYITLVEREEELELKTTPVNVRIM
jgi:hypothetical protein